MKEYIMEKPRKTVVRGIYDVIVVGGGIAGISAALSARRCGAKTLLIEREFALGGLATLGLVTIYLPLCDGQGQQISYGIVEELIRLSVKYGAEIEIPEEWRTKHSIEDRKAKRYMARFSSHMAAILYEEILHKEGVEILYGTQVCAATVEGEEIKNVIVENKSGRSAYRAKCFIDASGDADLAFYAGAEISKYTAKNAEAAWYYAHEKDKVVLHPLGVADVVDEDTDQEADEKTLAEQLDKKIRYSGIDAEENSRYMIKTHETIKKHFLNMGEISEEHNLTSMPMIPQFRMTRRIVGVQTIYFSGREKHYENSIGMIGDWTRRGPSYELPFGCLRSKNVRNLLAAGRCISVDDSMWELTRVIPACAITGEAAGIAASVYARKNKFDMEKIKKYLNDRGCILRSGKAISNG